MHISYWCIFISLLLPWISTAIGKILGGFKKNHNIDPRQFEADLKGKAKNAIYAQQNSFEIFPAFATAILVAQQLSIIPQNIIDNLSILFIISRIIYLFAYLYNLSLLRSLIWFIGVFIIIILFIYPFISQ